MEIVNERQLKNGDYEWDVELTDEEKSFLINYAINDILKKTIEGNLIDKKDVKLCQCPPKKENPLPKESANTV